MRGTRTFSWLNFNTRKTSEMRWIALGTRKTLKNTGPLLFAQKSTIKDLCLKRLVEVNKRISIKLSQSSRRPSQNGTLRSSINKRT